MVYAFYVTCIVRVYIDFAQTYVSLAHLPMNVDELAKHITVKRPRLAKEQTCCGAEGIWIALIVQAVT